MTTDPAIDLKALKGRGYGDYHVEPFDEYLARWPRALSNFPADVVEQWVWRHWSDFERLWLERGIGEFQFDLAHYDNPAILDIGQHESFDDLAERQLDPRDPLDFYVGRYLALQGTFPVPIIVATNSEGLLDPRGLPMKPRQLIEGHRRLGMLRGLVLGNYPGLQSEHAVWELTLPRKHFLRIPGSEVADGNE